MFVILLKVLLSCSGVITHTKHLLGPAWDTSDLLLEVTSIWSFLNKSITLISD